MILHSRKDLIILKLINPEDFGYARSYESCDDLYHFEGFMLDEDQISGYGGEPYNDEYYFQLHSSFAPGRSLDPRGEDDNFVGTHPWAMIISGDHTMPCVFLRFRTYADMCLWLDKPTYEIVFCVY